MLYSSYIQANRLVDLIPHLRAAVALLYFHSGSIFPLKGVRRGVGFLDLPDALRAELRQVEIYALSGGRAIQLPVWLQVFVYTSPLSYQLSLLHCVALGYWLPMPANLAVACPLPMAARIAATVAMAGVRR